VLSLQPALWALQQWVTRREEHGRRHVWMDREGRWRFEQIHFAAIRSCTYVMKEAHTREYRIISDT
jgi:hypothetical protein